MIEKAPKVGVSDMAPPCQPCRSVWGGLRKQAMSSVCPSARHFNLSQYTTGALQAATLALELRGRESEWEDSTGDVPQAPVPFKSK